MRAIAVMVFATTSLTVPLSWPTLPPVAVAAILLAASPAVLTPSPLPADLMISFEDVASPTTARSQRSCAMST